MAINVYRIYGFFCISETDISFFSVTSLFTLLIPLIKIFFYLFDFIRGLRHFSSDSHFSTFCMHSCLIYNIAQSSVVFLFSSERLSIPVEKHWFSIFFLTNYFILLKRLPFLVHWSGQFAFIYQYPSKKLILCYFKLFSETF